MTPRDSLRAAWLRTAAIERNAMLDEDSALALYRAARAADPDYLPAQVEYIQLMGLRLRRPDLTREFAAVRARSALAACLAAATAGPYTTPRPRALLLALADRAGDSACTDLFLSWAPGEPPRDALAHAARAVREIPILREAWRHYAALLEGAGRWREAETALLEGLVHVDDPIAHVALASDVARVRLERGDTARAVALADAIGAMVRRDGRPGLWYAYLGAFCTPYWLPVRPVDEHSCREPWELARRARDWFGEWYAVREIGKTLLERGELASALPFLDRSIKLADSAGTAGVRLLSYTVRGRAYAKLGRLGSAVRDLRRAIAASDAADDPYLQADAYHNLAHAYEAEGRFAEAAGAVDTFVALTERIPLDPIRMIARHDAGMIRWEAGWHAAAARDFAAMVRIVDALSSEQYYAGEYYERIGDLGRALRYYRAGVRAWNGDTKSLTALTRVYEALGMPDSAAAAARLHDAQPRGWTILEGPLLPGVLARQGRMAEAVAVADAWARHELAAGNVQGAALANLRVAELLLAEHRPEAARAAAARGDSLSRVLKLTDEATQARTLEGRALFEAGMRSEGVATLRAAAALARDHPTTAAVLGTELALGDALRGSGARSSALAAYDRAAVAVERLTTGIESDPDRTGFRALHLAPFDGALRILLSASARSSDAEAALRWSARRKGAALVLAGVPAGAALGAPSVAELRARLGPDEALIDYTVLDSAVTAIVVRPRSASVVPLHASLARLATWTDLIRRPLVAVAGGRVDLAHAPFDMVAAESLFTVLVSPLESALGGAQRLTIVPDGVLWYVPFAALVTPPSADPSSAHPPPPGYLIDRYVLRLLPSAQFLGGADEGNAIRKGFRVLALSYSVPGGAAELAAVRRALGEGRVTTREGSAATERAALDLSADVLHLAVHGLVDDRDPLASHLQLAPDGRDDGLLHLTEIAGRRLTPRLAVLTACEAVSGRLYAGEGLVGLARAFLVGGARQVVASEWPVDSSAAELMGAFYRQLALGAPPAAALRAAQLALRNQSATAHPIHWAGFVVFEAGAARGGRVAVTGLSH